jgi:hypothetical protein
MYDLPGMLLTTSEMALEHFVHISLKKMLPNLVINLESKDKNLTYALG